MGYGKFLGIGKDGIVEGWDYVEKFFKNRDRMGFKEGWDYVEGWMSMII